MINRYFCANCTSEIPLKGKCFIWANKKEHLKLLELGYDEKECQTCDREAFLIDSDKMEFEVVHKHIVIE